MNIHITIDGTTVEKVIPTRWDGPKDEVIDFGTFLQLAEVTDPSKILAILTGVPHKKIKTAKIRNVETIIHLLGFLTTQAPAEVPEKILGYPIPKNLGFETIGQYEDLLSEIKPLKKPTDIMKKYPLFCAIYATDPYDWKQAEKLAPEFLKAPAAEVLAVGNFTFVKLIGLKNSIPMPSHQADTPLKKFSLVTRNWIRRTVSTARFYIWKRRHPLPAKSS